MLFLYLILFCLIGGTLYNIWYIWRRDSDRLFKFRMYPHISFITAMWIVGGFSAVVGAFTYGQSYHTYVEIRAFYDHVQYQYKDALVIYEEKAILRISEQSFTDFRYEGYQQTLGEFIRELRDQIALYNREYSRKITWKQTIVGFFIVPPQDDMRPIELREE